MKLSTAFWNLYSLSLASAAVFPCACAEAADYPTTILGDKPVAYYRLEELAGAMIAVDSSGNHLNGTYIFNDAGSPQLGLPGIDTNSILLSYPSSNPGDFGYVDIPYNASLSPVNSDGLTGAPFSAECWVQPATVSPSDDLCALAMSGPDAGGAYNNGSGWSFYEGQTTPATWQLFMSTSATVQVLSAPDPIAMLQWYHLAVTWDGTNAIFYVNGTPQASMALNSYLAVPNYDAAIGAGPQGGHQAFLGGIDEVAFYANALTQAQILNHYKVGTNSFRGSLNLSFATSSNNIVLRWPSGSLQESASVNGTYTNVTGALSPLTVTPSAARAFFRLKGP